MKIKRIAAFAISMLFLCVTFMGVAVQAKPPVVEQPAALETNSDSGQQDTDSNVVIAPMALVPPSPGD